MSGSLLKQCGLRNRPLFGWLGKWFVKDTAVELRRRNPVLVEAIQASALIYDRIPLREFIDDQRRDQLARDLYLEVNRICNSGDPRSRSREAFAAAMLRLAAYQVLVIPPVPAEDTSGLRDQPGISGELKAHLVALCDRNDDLRSAMRARTQSREFEDLWAIVQREYWELSWLVGTLDAARKALGDFVAEEDWYQPFLHACSVSMEHTYRWQLELPPVFAEEIAREAAGTYSVFTDIVLSGAANPAAEWLEYARQARVPLPSFGT